jgi:glycolate oxidase
VSLHPELKAALRKLLTTGFLDAPEDLRCYSYDMFARAEPETVVLPESTEQAAEVMALAQRYETPVTPRGAGTSLTGGPTPVRGGLVLGTARMNNVLDLSRADRIARVQAGVVTAHLQRAVMEQGLFYPPNPTSADYCTLGGNVATNAGGASGVKYGVTRDYLTGLTAVLPGGEILSTGGRCMKDVAGYDLTRLLCGSEGRLALVTEASVRLLPKPEAVRAMSAYFPDIKSTAEAVAAIMSSGYAPCTLELMDRAFLRAVKQAYEFDFPADAQALLLIEVDGFETTLNDQMQAIARICKEQGAFQTTVAADEAERQSLWQARRGGTAALVRQASFMVSLDYAVPVSLLPEAVDRIGALGGKHGLEVVVIAHAGDGNLHPLVIYDPKDTAQAAAFAAFDRDACNAVLELGGTLSGEHGIGMEKAAHLPRQLSPAFLRLAREIKRSFDPRDLLNPGKCESACGNED